jgi:hypothetical protein
MVSGCVDVPELLPVLESAGVSKVKYQHAKYREGGEIATVCTLFDPEHEVAIGYSKLHPKDNFSRRIGRVVALKKAVAQLDIKKRRHGA